LPEFLVEGDLVRRLEAAECEFEIEVVEFLAKHLSDLGTFVALDQVIADEVQNGDERRDLIIHSAGPSSARLTSSTPWRSSQIP
jgi:hypothetical protein